MTDTYDYDAVIENKSSYSRIHEIGACLENPYRNCYNYRLEGPCNAIINNCECANNAKRLKFAKLEEDLLFLNSITRSLMKCAKYKNQLLPNSTAAG